MSPHATNTRAVTVAVMLATFLTALDITVVGTAMPTIIGSLGGLALYSWVFSAYLLTSTTVVPLCGRLADMHGRKPVFMAGAVLFLAGSAMCGAASTMEELILFRAIQGLGAGAILPASITVIGDVFSVEQRARVQGLLSGVWGVSSIIGPAVGGLIVDRFEWRWVFYVNLPVGLLAMLLFALSLHETVAGRRRTIDYAGAAGLAAAATLLLLGLLETGQDDTTVAGRSWALLLASGVVLALFLWHETRVRDPLLPLGLLRTRVVSVANAAGFLGGAVLLGASSFVPPLVQGVMGGTALSAGAALAPMSIGWPIASSLSGRLVLRHGYRPIVLLGSALILAGALLLLPAGMSSTMPGVMLAMAVMGLGMGFSMTSFLVAVQSSVGWGQRGIATATVQFFRSIGSVVGVAALGAVMNAGIHEGLHVLDKAHPGAINASSGVSAASFMLDPVARGSIPSDILDALRLVLASSLHSVYVGVALAALGGLALTFLFPRITVGDQAHSESATSNGADSLRDS